MQETGEIIRAVRQQLPASKPDKEVEKFPLDQIGIRMAGSIRKRSVGKPERTCIASQSGEPIEQLLIGSTRQECRQQRIFFSTRRIDLIQIDGKRVGTVRGTGCLFEARLSHLTLRRCRRPGIINYLLS